MCFNSIKRVEIILGLATEWHAIRNGELTPDTVSLWSSKKVWWECSKTDCGHEWETIVAARSAGNGCPACYKRSRSKVSLSPSDMAPYI